MNVAKRGLWVFVLLASSMIYAKNRIESVKATPKKPVVEVAFAELLDKISILKIKLERISDEKKLFNIRNEYETLMETYHALITPSDRLIELETELKKYNEILWETEDILRGKEAKKTFDDEFIQFARSVYFTNDDRCAVKREINELLGSRLIEEKSYASYR